MSSAHDEAVLDSIFNPYLPLGESLCLQSPQQDDYDEEESSSSVEAKMLEVEGVKKAEEKDLNAALELLTQAVELAPLSASPFNNRAQVYRLLGNESAALEDLSRAVQLSRGQGKAGVQALCQRALINRHRGDTESARSDFQAAAQQGSDFASHQLVQMNPYAAMCNQMLQQVFSKLQQPSESV